MYSTPGGPQQALIQSLAGSFGGGPGQARRTGHGIISDGFDPQTHRGFSFTGPPPMTPYGNFHEAPNQDELGPNAGQWPAQAPAPPLDPAVATAMGVPHPQLHPLIQHAMSQIRPAPEQRPEHGLGFHPQLDRFHGIHASQNLAALMAQLSARSLKRNQYGGRH